MLSKNDKSIDFYNCGKGEDFQKGKLMKIYVETSNNGHAHVYHTYDRNKKFTGPHCQFLTFDLILDALRDRSCYEITIEYFVKTQT